MAEFYCLVTAGISAAAAHLLSNHCNTLRDQYYKELNVASQNKSPINFINFMVKGFRDGLREQLKSVYEEHKRLVWHDVTEQKITGSVPTRQRRIELARLLGNTTNQRLKLNRQRITCQ